MQVTPSNALFAALSTQLQSVQQNSQKQSQTQISKAAEESKPSQGSSRIARSSEGQTPATLLNSSGQVETNGVVLNPNLREAPHAGQTGEQAFTAPGSVVDIIV